MPTLKDIQDEIEEIRRIFMEQSQKRLTCYLLMKTALTLTSELRANDRQLRARLRHLRDALCPSVAAPEAQPTRGSEAPVDHRPGHSPTEKGDMMSKTTFSGTVYGAFQDPRKADASVIVVGCNDGSVAIAWGSGPLLNAIENETEILHEGAGDGDHGYHVIIDPPDLRPVGEYIAATFFQSLDSSEWYISSNGDIHAGLNYLGHLGDDGTISVASNLEACGLDWLMLEDLIDLALLVNTKKELERLD